MPHRIHCSQEQGRALPLDECRDSPELFAGQVAVGVAVEMAGRAVRVVESQRTSQNTCPHSGHRATLAVHGLRAVRQGMVALIGEHHAGLVCEPPLTRPGCGGRRTGDVSYGRDVIPVDAVTKTQGERSGDQAK